MKISKVSINPNMIVFNRIYHNNARKIYKNLKRKSYINLFKILNQIKYPNNKTK
jgi:hypothetical protein